ncbi:MAG: response regulator transcription factor [Bacteroidota bacterium]
MAKILLAEDDPNLAYMVKENLIEIGHQVYWASNGEEAYQLYKKDQMEIALVDVMMPLVDGFELASMIRAHDDVLPIIFLSAKSEEEDRLKGFGIGGDDYVTKPFSIRELEYKINVFVRRSIQEHQKRNEKVILGAFELDPVNLTLEIGEERINLTQMESQLLKMLADDRNRLISRSQILEKIWGEDDYFKGRSLDVFIARLRKYLAADRSLMIQNSHGVGFMLVDKNY